MVTYQWRRYDQLTTDQLYDILALRQAVFIIEQNCPYLDMDGLDRHSYHLLARDEQRDLVAYLRLVAPGVKFAESSLGRIVTSLRVRGTGLGRQIMLRGIAQAKSLYPGSSIRLAAQLYAKGFYEALGFEQVSAPFDEDGILHIEMLRRAD